MSGFVVIALALTAAALLWVLPPLLRRRPLPGGVARPVSNLTILRDQLAELDADLRNGVISAAQHANARREIERRVIEETAAEPAAARSELHRSRWSAAALAFLIPMTAILLYLRLGNPEGLSPQQSTAANHQLTPEQIDKMVARLAARLEKNPNDPEGWAILARSYIVLQRFPEAVKAYAKATDLIKNDADLYADYADALAMTQGRHITGKALELVNRALEINPNHSKALALAGSAAFANKDYKGALTYWEKLQQQLQPDSDFAQMIGRSIAEARELGGIKTREPLAKATTAAGASISGRVVLSPELAGKASPGDTVFILARAPNGPPMPLAVIRRQVKDLPLDFTLDDSLAMSPAAKLSGFAKVALIARVSKSGGVMPQSGDLEGTDAGVEVGSKGVSLVINQVVP